MNAKKSTPDEPLDAAGVPDEQVELGADVAAEADAQVTAVLAEADAQATAVLDETEPRVTAVLDATDSQVTAVLDETDVQATAVLDEADVQATAVPDEPTVQPAAVLNEPAVQPTAVLPPAAQTIPTTTPYVPPANAPQYATVAEASADILPPDPMAPSAAAVAPAPVVALGAPRTRWAGILWGLVLAALAGIALAITLDPAKRSTLADWWLSINGVTGTAYAFLALGVVAVVCAVVGIIGRAQRKRIARRSAS